MMASQASAAFVASMKNTGHRRELSRRVTLVMNNLQAKVNWQFTTKDDRVKLKRLYQTTTS